MCFRPHKLTMGDSSIQTGTCPSCGMPISAEAGVTSGECPHCHKPIPVEPESGTGGVDPSGQNKKIF